MHVVLNKRRWPGRHQARGKQEWFRMEVGRLTKSCLMSHFAYLNFMRRNCSRKEWMQQPDMLGFAPQRLPLRVLLLAL